MISVLRCFIATATCLTVLSLASCNRTSSEKAEVSDAKQAPALPAEAVEYDVDTEKSSMTWIGAKVTNNHNGTIKMREGFVSVKENRVVGGRFVFDMMTLRSEDLELGDPDNNKLTGHLLSPDFFDVAHHPTAEFEITAVEPLSGQAAEPDSVVQVHERVVQNNVSKRVEDPTHMVTGNLIIKGVSKSVKFPARISLSDTSVTTQANFLINRTDWNLNYQSEKSLANKMIFHEVNVVLDVVANK